MKKILTFYFLLFFLTGFAQTGFIHSYKLDSIDVRFTNLLLSNDTLIVSGIAVAQPFLEQQSIFIAKIDTNGILLNYKLYSDSLGADYSWANELPFGLKKASDDSGYLLLTHVFQRGNGAIMKVNNQGELIWIREYPHSSSLTQFFQIIQEVEGGYLVGGRTQPLSGDLDIFLFKIDENGNKIWEKSYGASMKNETLNSLIIQNNNEYVLGGSTGTNNLPWNQWHNQVQIFAVDSLGNEKWYWESDPVFDTMSIEDMSCRALHQDDGGNWVYATTKGEFVPNTGGAMLTQGSLVKRDSNFNLITSKMYDGFEGDRTDFLNVIPLEDGDLLLLGSDYDFVPDPINSETHVYNWMIRTTSSGDSLWMRKDLTFPDTGEFTQQYLHSAVELPSGNIIAAGYYDAAYQSQTDYGLLIKVNQHGCIDTTNCIPTNITSTFNLVEISDLKVFPNPTDQVLHYESELVPIWDKIELLDITGRVLYAEMHNNEITMSDLPSGIYLLRLWKDGQFYTRKVVKQ